jgi:hypothetical protein
MKVIRTTTGEPAGPPLTAESAKKAIRDRGNYRVAIVIPKGYHESPNTLHRPNQHRGLLMFYDELDPMESQIAGGLVQMAAGRQVFTQMFSLGGKAPSTRTAGEPDERMLVKIDRQSIRVHRMENAAKHTFLAGLVPMFLLFSAAGAARGLLESLKSGEVRRMMAAPVPPTCHILGSLTTMLVVQMTQCYVMYTFAWLVFGVKIWDIPVGLFAVTLSTALATIGFGLMLGSLCKNPDQLDALGTMIIMAMSAVGGSMVPRHIMPYWMQKFGLLTINGWSFDAFMSVIGFEGIAGIAPKCAVLLTIAAGCAILGSILLGRRMRGGVMAQ